MHPISEQTHSHQILIIDNDEGECCRVEDILGEEGIEVIKAVGGEEGIRILGENDFSIVIINLRMPDIDGYGIIDFLKKRRKNSTVIVMTEKSNIKSIVDAMQNGAYDYIIKPFVPGLLKLTVKKALDYVQLRDDRNRLQEFDLVNELARTMSHEVFQPLTVLMGYANDILRGSQEEIPREAATHILNEARKIRDIIRKMDNLSIYEKKSFPGGHTIIDIDKGTPEPG